MNKSYDYIDGKVILQDKDGKRYAENVWNNTYDIVKQENLIEEINQQIADTENQKDKFKPSKTFHIIDIILWLIVASIPGSLLLFRNIGFNLVQKIIPVFFSISFGIMAIIINHTTYKKELRKVAGYEQTLEYLKKKKLMEQKNLEKLRSESREIPFTEKEEGYKTIEVDDTYQEMLKQEMEDAFKTGYNRTLTRKRKNNFNK